MAKAAPPDVDAYIGAAPSEARAMLRQLRSVITAAAPMADEKISYGMPFYEYHGRLVYFAGYKNHVGFYAAIPDDRSLADQLKKYLAAKSTVQFPVGEPLPVALITKVVKARVRENESRA